VNGISIKVGQYTEVGVRWISYELSKGKRYAYVILVEYTLVVVYR